MNNNDTTTNTDRPFGEFHECGTCRRAMPGAVDHGCRCGMTSAERDEDARQFARMHD